MECPERGGKPAPRVLPLAGRQRRRSVLTLTLVTGIAGLLWIWSAQWGAHWHHVQGNSMHPTYHDSDLILTWDSRTWNVGDVVVYTTPAVPNQRIVHRIIDGDPTTGWTTQGDNNPLPDNWRVNNRDITGQVVLDIPRAGPLLTFALSPYGTLVLLSLLSLYAYLRLESIRNARSRVAVQRTARVGGHQATSINLSTDSGAFHVPKTVFLDDDTPVSIAAAGGCTAHGTLHIARDTYRNHVRTVGGTITWNTPNDAQLIATVLTLDATARPDPRPNPPRA